MADYLFILQFEDDPGDPYPQDDCFIGGGGGFGSVVANITLRKGATIVFEARFRWKNPDFLLKNHEFIIK